MIASRRLFTYLILPLLTIVVGGCGSNIEEILYQAVAATGRTAFDLFLTDLANDFADRLDDDEGALDDTDGDDDSVGAGDMDDGDDADGGDDMDGGGGSVGGDAAVGETVFTMNGCGSCHCADASGGCALDAPALQNADGGTLDEFLRADTPHTGGKHDLTDQDILDLQAYLNALG